MKTGGNITTDSRSVAPGRCGQQFGRDLFSETMPCESSTDYRSLANSHSGRLRILFRKIHQLPRKTRAGLRYRGSRISWHQTPRSARSLPQTAFRLGSRRVSLYADANFLLPIVHSGKNMPFICNSGCFPSDFMLELNRGEIMRISQFVICSAILKHAPNTSSQLERRNTHV